jgi:hypothetical protein
VGWRGGGLGEDYNANRNRIVGPTPAKEHKNSRHQKSDGQKTTDIRQPTAYNRRQTCVNMEQETFHSPNDLSAQSARKTLAFLCLEVMLWCYARLLCIISKCSVKEIPKSMFATFFKLCRVALFCACLWRDG